MKKAGWISGWAVLALGGAAALATPSYTAVFLPSPAGTNTYAKGIASNGQIVGYSLADEAEALLWATPYSTPVSLNPTGYTGSQAFATDGAFQAGEASTGTSGDAILWNNTAQSAVDLNPTGYSLTEISSIANGQEVGLAFQANGGAEHAMLWTGTAASDVDLNPPGFQTSVALGTNGSQQVGSGTTTINSQPSGYQALLWNGTAASAQNITPAGYSEAQAFSISGNLAAGWGTSGSQQDALLWNISDGAVTDLGPGFAYAVAGNYEVGYRGNDAMVWSGTADSAINLQAYLPTGYVYSVAYGVDANGDIVGAAGSYGQWQAVIWLVPEPAATAIIILIAVPITRRNRPIR